jgi:putative transposase
VVRRTLPESFFDSVKRDLGILENSCIFTLSVTTWLMIVQRLSENGTLASAVSELIHGNGQELLEPCKRVREETVSANTGAYSQARNRMPVAAAQQVAQQTFEQLHQISSSGGLRDRLFLLDGSSIRLSHTPAIVKSYPPAENQYGKSHWPVARITVMHHVMTGLATVPACGPMYGPNAVSEQGLAETLINRLPPASVLIGDRNFGVFTVLWCAHRQGHAVLTRLTEARAKRLSGGDLSPGRDHQVVWQPSRDDRRAHPEVPDDARIEGRLIVTRPEHMKEALYLFTTLPEPAEQTATLYKERWHIETDLRSLKEQVRLHTIPARSPDMVIIELLMAVASYNLIRAVMREAARQIDIEPRRLSFSRSRDAFWAFARATAHLLSQTAFDRHWRLLLRSIGQCRLPKRNRPPEPRLVWNKPHGFPRRKLQN